MKAALLLSMLLSGCVSISYAPIYADSPPPSAATQSLCEAPVNEKTLTLAEGASCVFPIRADAKLTRTPLATGRGKTYRVTVPRNQVWYDAARRSIPSQGDPGSAMMNVIGHWKRQDSLWFALIAANVSGDVRSTEEYATQDVTIDPVLSFEREGVLGFYPNDAVTPSGRDFYYNNRGQVWVQIERCAASCTSIVKDPVPDR